MEPDIGAGGGGGHHTPRLLLLLSILLLSLAVSHGFFVDIIKDRVGPGTEEDVMPRVWYRKRSQDDFLRSVQPSVYYPQTVYKRKQPSLVPVSFWCNKRTAVCKNGGKGPRINISKKGYAMCVCLCPMYYTGKQCDIPDKGNLESSPPL